MFSIALYLTVITMHLPEKITNYNIFLLFHICCILSRNMHNAFQSLQQISQLMYFMYKCISCIRKFEVFNFFSPSVCLNVLFALCVLFLFFMWGNWSVSPLYDALDLGKVIISHCA